MFEIMFQTAQDPAPAAGETAAKPPASAGGAFAALLATLTAARATAAPAAPAADVAAEALADADEAAETTVPVDEAEAALPEESALKAEEDDESDPGIATSTLATPVGAVPLAPASVPELAAVAIAPRPYAKSAETPPRTWTVSNRPSKPEPLSPTAMSPHVTAAASLDEPAVTVVSGAPGGKGATGAATPPYPAPVPAAPRTNAALVTAQAEAKPTSHAEAQPPAQAAFTVVNLSGVAPAQDPAASTPAAVTASQGATPTTVAPTTASTAPPVAVEAADEDTPLPPEVAKVAFPPGGTAEADTVDAKAPALPAPEHHPVSRAFVVTRHAAAARAQVQPRGEPPQAAASPATPAPVPGVSTASAVVSAPEGAWATAAVATESAAPTAETTPRLGSAEAAESTEAPLETEETPVLPPAKPAATKPATAAVQDTAKRVQESAPSALPVNAYAIASDADAKPPLTEPTPVRSAAAAAPKTAAPVESTVNTPLPAGTLAPEPRVAPVATAEPAPARPAVPPEAAEQTVHHVRLMLRNGQQSLRIRLVPARLGALSVEVTTTADAQVHVRLTASTHEARQSIEAHTALLREGLARDGIEAPRIEVHGPSTPQTVAAQSGFHREAPAQQPGERGFGGHTGQRQSGQPEQQQPGYAGERERRNARWHTGQLNVYA